MNPYDKKDQAGNKDQFKKDQQRPAGDKSSSQSKFSSDDHRSAAPQGGASHQGDKKTGNQTGSRSEKETRK